MPSEHSPSSRGIKRRMLHSLPVHSELNVSHLSIEFPRQDFRGLYNLIVLLLIVNLARMAAENVLKYGLIVPMPWRLIAVGDLRCAVRVAACVAFNVAFSYALRSASWLGFAGNFALGLALPLWIVWESSTQGATNPLIGMLLITMALVYYLKTVSFLAVTNEIDGMKANDRAIIENDVYGDQPTSFAFFLAAPTLCYQPTYPMRQDGMRPLYLAKNGVRMVSCFAAMYVISTQFIYPTLRNAVIPMAQRNVVAIGERIVKLSVSSLGVWLIGFYAIFHCWLNMVAEVTGFADRNFYQDWWNAGSIEEYWRLWNVPVHTWLKRHLYRPLRKRGCPLWLASLSVFLFSAVVHEVIFSVPLRSVHFWAFSAMLFQLPLVLVSHYVLPTMGRTAGNVVFWVVFCLIGQPVGILLYYWSYYERFVLQQ